MTLKITINMDSAAFEDNDTEARDILETLAESLDRAGVVASPVTELSDGPIMDSNGNTVGEWSVTL